MERKEWVGSYYDAMGNNSGFLRESSKQKCILNKNAPEFIYQYIGLGIHDLKNIEGNYVWAGKACNMNDPYDCYYSDSIFSDLEKLAKEKNSAFLIEMCSKEKMKFKDTCEKIRNMIVLSCFSETFDSILMWSHYANQHKGICVQYRRSDFTAPSLLCSSAVLRPVSYGRKISVFDESIHEVNKKENFKILIRKAEEWQYEEEWRLLCVIPEGDLDSVNKSGGMLLKTPKPCKIILGTRADDKSKEEVRSLCEKLGIKLSHMKMKDDEFFLEEIYDIQ